MKRFVLISLQILLIGAILWAADDPDVDPVGKKPKVDVSGLTIHTLSIYNTAFDTYGSTTGLGYSRTFGSGGTVAWICRACLSVPLLQHGGEGAYGFKNTDFRGEYTTWLITDLGFGIAVNGDERWGHGRVGLLVDWVGTLAKNNSLMGLGFGMTADYIFDSGFYLGLCGNWYPWMIREELMPDTRAFELALNLGFRSSSVD